MARDPRARVFVLFLDTYHTGIAGSHRMRTALVTLLNRILGPDDLIGVMTPGMTASDVTLARRTETIEDLLSRHWNWGRRDQTRGPRPRRGAVPDLLSDRHRGCREVAGDPRTAEQNEQWWAWRRR